MTETNSLAAEAERYLLEPEARRDPYEMLMRLQAEDPVHKSEAGPWLVTKHNLAQAILKDPRFSRAEAVELEVPRIFNPGEAMEHYKVAISASEGERHRRLRGVVASWFTPKAVQQWQPLIDEVIEDVVGGLAPRRAMDLVPDLSLPIPERVICSIVGIPLTDHALFESWATVLSNRPLAGAGSDEDRARKTAASLEFIEYLKELIIVRRSNPTDDLISRLIATKDEGGKLDDREMETIVLDLLRGGHETTASMITNCMWILLEHPEQWALLKADPDLAPSAVNEILRYRSSVQVALVRVTTEDVQLGDKLIPRGEVVIASYAAANRDPDFIVDGHRLDITRGTSQLNVGLGYGRHLCLGAHLARAEVSTSLRSIAAHMPGIRLAKDSDDLAWRNHALISAPKELPVVW